MNTFRLERWEGESPASLCSPSRRFETGAARAACTFLLVLTLLSGCAFGRVRPNGELVGLAVGHAKLETCTTVVPDNACWEIPPTLACQRIEGGALSSTAAEAIGSLITTAGTAFAAHMGGIIP